MMLGGGASTIGNIALCLPPFATPEQKGLRAGDYEVQAAFERDSHSVRAALFLRGRMNHLPAFIGWPSDHFVAPRRTAYGWGRGCAARRGNELRLSESPARRACGVAGLSRWLRLVTACAFRLGRAL